MKKPESKPSDVHSKPRERNPGSSRKSAAALSSSDLQSVVFGEIQTAALAAATANNMTNLVPVDEGLIGDLPWYWQVGTNFNALTYDWLNNIFTYSSDGYVGSDGQPLMTGYYNVLEDTAYSLDSADASTLNQANLQAASTINTLITDWTTSQGAFPSGTSTQGAQLAYIMTQVLTWGTPGLTLGQLRSSTNPTSLLPNVPLGANQIVNDLMTYLGQTSSVANIQAAVVSSNAQLAQMRANVQTIPATAASGFMQTVNDSGNTQIVPAITIVESTGNIQNALFPAPITSGQSFTASYTFSSQSSSTVQVQSSSGAIGVGDLVFLLAFSDGSSSYNAFSFNSSLTTCSVTLTFNGVTTFTPSYSQYNLSTGSGWWNPQPIAQAAANTPLIQSGYSFTQNPGYDFGANGNFGLISRLLISQQPVISLTYTTSDYSSFQQTFQQNSSWGITFLGIGLGGGSNSYFQATTSQNASAGTVTLTMSPPGTSTPVAPTDQLAYVVGAEVLWPGAPAA